MKMTLLAASALVSFSGFAQAAEACETKCKKACDKKTECAEKCDKEKKCDSKKECATKAEVTHFNVSGMTCTGCSKGLTAKLNALEGVSVKKVCHKSGSVDVVISEKATAEQVKSAIVANGFQVAAAAEKKG